MHTEQKTQWTTTSILFARWMLVRVRVFSRQRRRPTCSQSENSRRVQTSLSSSFSRLEIDMTSLESYEEAVDKELPRKKVNEGTLRLNVAIMQFEEIFNCT